MLRLFTTALLPFCGLFCVVSGFDLREICANLQARQQSLRGICTQLESAQRHKDRDRMLNYWLSSSRDLGGERRSSQNAAVRVDPTEVDELLSYIASFGPTKRRSDGTGGKFMRFGRSAAHNDNSSEQDDILETLAAADAVVSSGELIEKDLNHFPKVQSVNDIAPGDVSGKPLDGGAGSGMKATQKRFMRFGRKIEEQEIDEKGRSHKENTKSKSSLPKQEKRFMRFGKRVPEIAEPIELRKKFMRFGKREDGGSLPVKLRGDEVEVLASDESEDTSGESTDSSETSPAQDLSSNDVDAAKRGQQETVGNTPAHLDTKRFMRFGKRFMRFGKKSVPTEDEPTGENRGMQSKEKRFMRFGKRAHPAESDSQTLAADKRFMRFGKRRYSDDIIEDEPSQVAKRFMRFGRRLVSRDSREGDTLVAKKKKVPTATLR